MAKKDTLHPYEPWRSAEYEGAEPEPGPKSPSEVLREVAKNTKPKTMRVGGISSAARDLLLSEREKTYGDFKSQGAFAHHLKQTFRSQPKYQRQTGAQKEALDMIGTKISRLLYGDPFVKDTWNDIAGYAKLGSEACE